MQTEVLSEPRLAAWLEFTPLSSSVSETIRLEAESLVMGRSETTDVPIDSNRVSREHAVLERRGDGWRVRDLRSTNGTFVNGSRVEESPLQDGDTLLIADVEFTFRIEQGNTQTVSFTQVMTQGETGRGSPSGFAHWVRTLRRLREAMLRGGLPAARQPVHRLDTRELFGHEILGDWEKADGRSGLEKQIFATDCLLNERLREVQRLAAIDELAGGDAATRLLVSLAPAEVGARRLVESLDLLRAVSGERQLIVEIPVNAVCDTPHFREFLAILRDRGIGVLYDNFAGRSSHAALQEGLAPDYVKLAGAATRGVEQSSDAQRQVQAVVRACAELNCEVVAQGLAGAAAADLCRDLGCTLGQGEYFQTVSARRA